MDSGNPMSWLEKRSDVRGKLDTLDGTMSCTDLLFQKGSVKQIHPKGIDVDSRGPSECSGSRYWSHRSPEGRRPLVTRRSVLMGQS